MAPSFGVWSCTASLLLAALGTASGAAAQPTAVGPEFQINTYTTNFQSDSSVAADADGDFVVVWDSVGSSGSDTSSYSVQGQRYNSAGSAVGSQFQVNTYTTNQQRAPSIAADADGDFVVVWSGFGSLGSDSSYASIQGQRYNSAGSAVGSQFQINTYTAGGQQDPSVAADADGDFVVVWWSIYSSSGDNTSIQGQRYDSAGSAVGSQFQVNTYTTSAQRIPSVDADMDGDFVVVWQSNGSSGGDTHGESIQGQRYTSAGSAVGSEFQVNTYTSSDQRFASVAADADGDFVVVWQSNGSSGGDTQQESIQGQRYNSAGSAVGSQFQVNTYTSSYQQVASVAADADGDFVVAWHSSGSPGDDNFSASVQAQRYHSAGSAVGSQFQVNTYTTSAQRWPSVAADADRDFVVVWSSIGPDDTSGIQGQRYTTAAAVPSLSPVALAAAALLMCLAVGVALRRRT